MNYDLIDSSSTAGTRLPNYLNQLLASRGSNYGWGWNRTRQADNRIILNQKATNTLRMVTDRARMLSASYRLPPLSMKGRTAFGFMVTALGFRENSKTSFTLVIFQSSGIPKESGIDNTICQETWAHQSTWHQPPFALPQLLWEALQHLQMATHRLLHPEIRIEKG